MEEMDFSQVSTNMIDLYVDNAIVSCIAKLGVIKSIFSELVIGTDGYLPIADVSLCIDDEDEDYILILDQEGIWIDVLEEQFFTHYLFVQDDCSTKYMKLSLDKPLKTFSFEVQSCNGDCDNCPYSEDEDYEEDDFESGDMHGFSMSKTDEFGTRNFSFYSQDINMVEEMRKDWKQFLSE